VGLTDLCAPAAAGSEAVPGILVDRIVAVVNEEPILLSDLKRRAALDQLQKGELTSPQAAARAALDHLLEERLLAQELERMSSPGPSLEDISLQLLKLQDKLGGEENLQSKLNELGITRRELEENLTRQLRLYRALEDRLGPRVFVSPEEIRRHYEEVLLPDLAARGLPPVELDDVRAAIRELLFQQKFDQELKSFLLDLRRQADVVDLLERSEPTLPPLTLRLTISEASAGQLSAEPRRPQP
jgi:hypothetical protein